MQILEIFKQAIADTFYDKDIEIWTSGTIKDDEGSIIRNGKLDKLDSFKGNFQFSTREYIQQEYGKEIEANAIVTCSKTRAEIGNILIYDNKEYTIKSLVPSDSHITLLVEG
jgi:hypothetical protein